MNKKLEDFVGLHTLDARGEYVRGRDVEREQYEDALVVLLRLDRTIYAFQEDPCDGYRSALGEAREADAQDLQHSLAAFAPIVCNFMIRTTGDYNRVDHVLYAVDERTDLIVLEIGTDNTHDYYPSFVSSWTPEGVPLRERNTWEF